MPLIQKLVKGCSLPSIQKEYWEVKNRQDKYQVFLSGMRRRLPII